jgi:GAF domain-containing protein
VFRDVVEKQSIMCGPLEATVWNEVLLDGLGGGEPVEAFVAPVIAGDEVVAVLYGDNLPEESPVGETEALEIFLTQAGFALEKAILERRLREMKGEGP